MERVPAKLCLMSIFTYALSNLKESKKESKTVQIEVIKICRKKQIVTGLILLLTNETFNIG